MTTAWSPSRETVNKAREAAVGLTDPTPVLVPLMMNYLDDGVEAIDEVPVYFTAAGLVTNVVE